MEQLLFHGGEQTGLSEDRTCAFLDASSGMGLLPSSQPKPTLDCPQVLEIDGGAKVDIPLAPKLNLPTRAQRYTDQKACQSARRPESVRRRLGLLEYPRRTRPDRGSPSREIVEETTGKMSRMWNVLPRYGWDGDRPHQSQKAGRKRRMLELATTPSPLPPQENRP